MLGIFGETLSHLIEADTNLAFCDEVDVCDFIFFVKNQAIFSFLFKFSRLKPKADAVQKLFVHELFCVTPRDEERTESEDDVIKHIIQNNVLLYRSWALAQVVIRTLHVFHPIVLIVVGEMAVNLIYQLLLQWFVSR